MKKQRSSQVESLKRRIASLEDEDVERLYGLEPVYEPGGGPFLAPEEFVAVRCPYCGERLDTRVDLTEGERTYIEDCQTCCRPIEFSVELEEDGRLRAVRVERVG